MILVGFHPWPQHLDCWHGIRRLQSSQHIGRLLGFHLHLVPSLAMSLFPDTRFNSCHCLLLMCPWFTLANCWNRHHALQSLCGNGLLSVLWDLPQPHPFSFYILQSSLELHNDHILLWPRNVSDGSPGVLIMLCVKVDGRMETLPLPLTLWTLVHNGSFKARENPKFASK